MLPRHLLYVFALLLMCAASLVIEPRPVSAAAPSFTLGTLATGIANPSSLAFGPDGRLYAGAATQIQALTLDVTGTSVTNTETVASGQSTLLGIAFDPTAPPSPVVVYASRQNSAATNSYEGVISTYTGPSWTRTDVITGLPSSAPFTNHFTNGIAFDDSGLLYMANGANTDAGLQSPNYPETPLSAAILVADVNDPGFDGTITYSPSGVPADDNVDQTGGDVSVFAPGTRNPYDLVLHSNGQMYATDNGPQGPNTSITCSTSGTGVAQNDELNRIESGDYYGFPNRNRGRTDARQCTYHAPSEGNGADFTAPILTLPAHCSCDGIMEYTSPQFSGAMQGDLIIAQFVLGSILRVELSGDGQSVIGSSTLQSGLDGPLDVTMGPTGIIYIAEFNPGRISYLAPVAKVGGVTGLVRAPVSVGGSDGDVALVGVLMVLGLIVMAGARLARRRS
ncbi:MAG: PQQ-dependent sugar dehydrogenase [Dehalococcoidia bacterium]